MLKKQHIYDTIIHTETKILKKTARNFNFCLIFSPNAYRDSVKTQYTMYFFIGTRRVRTSLFEIGFIFVGVVFADRK